MKVWDAAAERPDHCILIEFFFQYLPTQFYEEDKELKQNQNEIVYYSQIPFDVQDRPKI